MPCHLIITVGLSSNAEVIKGVQHIIADKISKDKRACDLLKSMWVSLQNYYNTVNI